MRFLADMGVDVRVVEWLRQHGHDAKHLIEEKLQRAPDEAVFAKGAAESRVIITFDLDFGEIVARTQSRAPSVILFRIRCADRPAVIAHLERVLPAAASALGRGAVVVIEETRFRIRALPIGREPNGE